MYEKLCGIESPYSVCSLRHRSGTGIYVPVIMTQQRQRLEVELEGEMIGTPIYRVLLLYIFSSLAVAQLTGADGAGAPGRSGRGGTKQPRQKYSMTDDYKSDIVICSSPIWARGWCRISPPRFLAECCKRQLNQVSLVFAVF